MFTAPIVNCRCLLFFEKVSLPFIIPNEVGYIRNERECACSMFYICLCAPDALKSFMKCQLMAKRPSFRRILFIVSHQKHANRIMCSTHKTAPLQRDHTERWDAFVWVCFIEMKSLVRVNHFSYLSPFRWNCLITLLETGEHRSTQETMTWKQNAHRTEWEVNFRHFSRCRCE